MKKLVLTCVGIAGVAGVVWLLALVRDDPPRYRCEEVSRGTIRATCTATGTVNPLKTVLVGTQVSGRIARLYADYNSRVTKGQLVAEIEPDMFEAQLEQARANLLSARATVAQAEANLKDARRTLARSRQLLDSRVIGQSEFDAAETQYAVAESQVGVARAQVVQSEAAFAYAQTNLRYTKIYSPVDGIVISRDVDEGQTVAASFQTPTLFTIAQDLREMQINTNVDEADIGRVAVGQEAEFTVDAFPRDLFHGRIAQVRNSPIVVQNVVTYDVVIRVDNPELKLKPGLTANVTIITDTEDDVLRIPTAALRFKPAADDRRAGDGCDGSAVWALRDGRAVCVGVTFGIDDYTWAHLLTGDLQEGDQVIVGYADAGRGRSSLL